MIAVRPNLQIKGSDCTLLTLRGNVWSFHLTTGHYFLERQIIIIRHHPVMRTQLTPICIGFATFPMNVSFLPTGWTYWFYMILWSCSNESWSIDHYDRFQLLIEYDEVAYSQPIINDFLLQRNGISCSMVPLIFYVSRVQSELTPIIENFYLLWLFGWYPLASHSKFLLIYFSDRILRSLCW